MSTFGQVIVAVLMGCTLVYLIATGIAKINVYYDGRTDKYMAMCQDSGNTFGSCYSIIKQGAISGQFSKQ